MTPSGAPEEVAARYLEHLTADAIAGIARRIRERVAGGLSDPEGFEERRRARGSAEYATYRMFVMDRHLRLVIVNGLALRELEGSPENQTRIQDTKAWLGGRWGPTSVRQAEFVQRGMLRRAIASLEATGAPAGAIGAQVETLLNRVEEHTVFVEERESERKLGEEIKIRVLRTTPNTFIVFGKGYARAVARRGVRLAMDALPSRFAKAVEETEHDYVAFIGERDPHTGRPRITRWTGAPWPV